jgi:hypothetical protein
MGTDTAYRAVFDISHKGFDWWFPLAGVGFVILGAGLIWLSRRYRWRMSKSWVGYFMVAATNPTERTVARRRRTDAVPGVSP